jgi:AhpC/TSA family protein
MHRKDFQIFSLEKGDREMCTLTKCRKSLLVLGLLLFGLLGAVRVSSALDVGDTAPDFSLPATTGGKISLSQFRGKKLVLIEFYGADFSPV